MMIYLVVSCSTAKDNEEKAFFEDKSIPLKQKLEKVLESENLSEMGLSEEEIFWIQKFYEYKRNQPCWINDSTFTEKGIQMKQAQNRSIWFGIPQNRLRHTKKKRLNWIEEEIQTTLNMSLITHDLFNGFIQYNSKKYKPSKMVSVEFMDSLMAAYQEKNWDRMFLSCGTGDTNYRFLADQLYNYCLKYPVDRTTFNVVTEKEDAAKSKSESVKSLVSKGYLLKENEADETLYLEALNLFQEHNGLRSDGKIGKYTALALNESNYNKILRASLSLDKIRQHSKKPKKFIQINIPEYTLRFVADDTLRAAHRIIVGKTVTPTPELESVLRNIVVYPYWTVPYSICKNEILPAARRNSGYFARNNYKLYSGSNEINPNSVNWKKIGGFPYKVVQNPGPGNSLGVIKFEFNNTFSVYVHDTPNKGLFNTDVRSYSHGCMRCDKPIDLAKTILDFDTMPRQKRNPVTRDTLDTLLSRRKNHVVPLKYSFPIMVEYITVCASPNLIFYPDIYKRDESYLRFMR